MSPEISVRLDLRQVENLDELVAEEGFASREDAIRAAVEMLVADVERRRRIDEAIVEGYRRIPQGEFDDAPWPDAIADGSKGGDVSR
jgi:Arc/MetJ-type ribon-helix-helix transcriptional regulator